MKQNAIHHIKILNQFSLKKAIKFFIIIITHSQEELLNRLCFSPPTISLTILDAPYTPAPITPYFFICDLLLLIDLSVRLSFRPVLLRSFPELGFPNN